jgi:hypothetical protein
MTHKFPAKLRCIRMLACTAVVLCAWPASLFAGGGRVIGKGYGDARYDVLMVRGVHELAAFGRDLVRQTYRLDRSDRVLPKPKLPLLMKRLLAESPRPFPVSRPGAEGDVKTQAALFLTSQNARLMLSHEFREGRYGAKAVAGTFRGASPTFGLFFRTGAGRAGVSFHHRDAVANLEQLNTEWDRQIAFTLEALTQTLEEHSAYRVLAGAALAADRWQRSGRFSRWEKLQESMPPLDGVAIGGADIPGAMHRLPEVEAEVVSLEKLPTTIDIGAILSYFKSELSARTLDAAVHLLERASVVKTAALRASLVRNHASFDDSQLSRFIGFQLSAKRVGGSLAVDRLEIDSSITAAQAGPGWRKRLGRLDDEQRAHISQSASQAIALIHERIAPELRAYRVIHFPRLQAFSKAGITILPPDGVRLSDMDK